MVIVSQDKKHIVNFDNIIALGVNENKIGFTALDGGSDYLGEYKSEERAKEVLKEIARHYKKSQGFNYCNDNVKLGLIEDFEKSGQDIFTYRMPED